eukprot:349260-Alexandrium_andersonii.AAC.1
MSASLVGSEMCIRDRCLSMTARPVDGGGGVCLRHPLVDARTHEHVHALTPAHARTIAHTHTRACARTGTPTHRRTLARARTLTAHIYACMMRLWVEALRGSAGACVHRETGPSRPTA